MFRLWGKIWKDNHMLKDEVVCDDREDTRTHKVFHCLEQLCYDMDLGNPSGWILRSAISRSMIKRVFTRIILLNKLILTTWRSK